MDFFLLISCSWLVRMQMVFAIQRFVSPCYMKCFYYQFLVYFKKVIGLLMFWLIQYLHFLVWIFHFWLQTANLDGETNLKIRKALERTWDYLTPEKASEFKGLTFYCIPMFWCLKGKIVCPLKYVNLEFLQLWCSWEDFSVSFGT